jgi:hypothetical protein
MPATLLANAAIASSVLPAPMSVILIQVVGAPNIVINANKITTGPMAGPIEVIAADRTADIHLSRDIASSFAACNALRKNRMLCTTITTTMKLDASHIPGLLITDFKSNEKHLLFYSAPPIKRKKQLGQYAVNPTLHKLYILSCNYRNWNVL